MNSMKHLYVTLCYSRFKVIPIRVILTKMIIIKSLILLMIITINMTIIYIYTFFMYGSACGRVCQYEYHSTLPH